MFKAILVDDERMSLEVLAIKLRKLAPEMEILATFQSSEEAVVGIRQLKPDVLFLDIEMPQMNGFQVLETVGDIPFALVFVTAYDRFALKAFKYSALDYLLKPIDTQELIATVHKIEKQRQTHHF